MPEKTCPVNDLIDRLRSAIDSGELPDPRNRRRAEDILALLNDVAWGRAAAGHLPAIESLARKIEDQAKVETAIACGKAIRDSLGQHREVFTSHIDTHNCSTGACLKLAPAPCQMTCPAGLDIPTYLTLIGMGAGYYAANGRLLSCGALWRKLGAGLG